MDVALPSVICSIARHKRFSPTRPLADTPAPRTWGHALPPPGISRRGVDWEIWLPVQGEPLPKRLRIVQKRRTGQPVADIMFTTWNLAPQISAATFAPTVPADYEGIAILQRAAAVKNSASAEPAPVSK